MGIEKIRRPVQAPAYETSDGSAIGGGGAANSLAAARALRVIPVVRVFGHNQAILSKGLVTIAATGISDSRITGTTALLGTVPFERTPAIMHFSSASELHLADLYLQPSQTTRYFGFSAKPYLAWDFLPLQDTAVDATYGNEERAWYWGMGRSWVKADVLAGTFKGPTGNSNDNGAVYLTQPKIGGGNAFFCTSDGVTVKKTDTGVDMLSATERAKWHDIEIYVDKATGDWVCTIDGTEVARHENGVDPLPVPLFDVAGASFGGDDMAEMRSGHICDADNAVAPVLARTKFYLTYYCGFAQSGPLAD